MPLIAVVVGGLVLGALGAFVYWRRKSLSAPVIPVVDWESKAQSAEERAQRAETAVKAGLIPHLARILRAKFVVGLLHQRSQLIESQEAGAERAEQIEERLAAAQAQLQQKLTGYEQKISTLEAQNGNSTATKTPGNAAATSATPPRRNPFQKRSAAPDPGPVEFSRILARRRQNPSAAEPEPPAEG
jgi:hypothetical protein